LSVLIRPADAERVLLPDPLKWSLARTWSLQAELCLRVLDPVEARLCEERLCEDGEQQDHKEESESELVVAVSRDRKRGFQELETRVVAAWSCPLLRLEVRASSSLASGTAATRPRLRVLFAAQEALRRAGLRHAARPEHGPEFPGCAPASGLPTTHKLNFFYFFGQMLDFWRSRSLVSLVLGWLRPHERARVRQVARRLRSVVALSAHETVLRRPRLELCLELGLLVNPVALRSLTLHLWNVEDVAGDWDLSGLVSLRVLMLTVAVGRELLSIARSLPRTCCDVRLSLLDSPLGQHALALQDFWPRVTHLSLPPRLCPAIVQLWAFLLGLRSLELQIDAKSLSLPLILEYLSPKPALTSLALRGSKLLQTLPTDLFPGLTKLALDRCPAVDFARLEGYVSRLSTFRFSGAVLALPWSEFHALRHLELEAQETELQPAQPVDLSPLTGLRTLRLCNCELPEEAWDMPELETLEVVLTLNEAVRPPLPGRMPRSPQLRRLLVRLCTLNYDEGERTRVLEHVFLEPTPDGVPILDGVQDLTLVSTFSLLTVPAFHLPASLRSLTLSRVALEGPYSDLACRAPGLERLSVSGHDLAELRSLFRGALVTDDS
jgi:hypothetical protein